MPSMVGGMTTAMYLRVSEDRDGDELGIDRYREACLRACERHHLADPVEYRDNNTTARKARGPDSAYARLIADARSGLVTTVVTPDLDRLTRTPREIEDWIDLAVNGVRLITADGEVDAATENGRMFMRIKAAVARHEIERKGARHRAEMLQRAKRGEWHGGRRPFGYAADGMTVVADEAGQVRSWVAALLAGRSITSICREAGKPIPVVRGIVTNPRIAGLRILRGVEYPGKWPALVDELDWRAVVALLADPDRKRSAGHTARRWLGAGLYECERCDGVTVKSAMNSAGKGRGHYPAYKCPRCSRSWKAEPLDEFIVAVVAKRLARPDLADLIPKAPANLRPPTDEAKQIRDQLNRLADSWASGALTDAMLETASARLQARLADAEARLVAQAGSNALGAVVAAEDPRAEWLSMRDIGQRQAIVRALMRIVLGAPPRGRAVWDPATFIHRLNPM
jgi:site-specific DNA recombinase